MYAGASSFWPTPTRSLYANRIQIELSANGIKWRDDPAQVGSQISIGKAARLWTTTYLGPPEGVFLNLTFLNLYRHGESYTESQYRAWMAEAGFRQVSRSRLEDGSTVFRARLGQQAP
jgi:hypothetical protein